jgi:hypothetical protein
MRRNGQANAAFARSFMRLGAAVAAVAAPAALGAFIRQSLQAAENIQDMADRAGVSAEFLQEMRYAATQSGAEIRDFDDAISRLNRRLGLFQQYLQTGTGEAGPAANALRTLGLESRIASGELSNAEDVFREAIRLIGDMESASQRAALASQLFGEDSGPRLQTLMALGEDGIRSLTDRARELGLVLNNEMIRKGAEASDQIETLGLVLRTNLLSAVIDNAEEIGAMAEAFTNAMPGMIELATRLADQMARVFGAGSADPTSALQAQTRLGRVGVLAGEISIAQAQDVPLTRPSDWSLRRRFREMMGQDQFAAINRQVYDEGLGFLVGDALRGGQEAYDRQFALMLDALRVEAERVRELKRTFEAEVAPAVLGERGDGGGTRRPTTPPTSTIIPRLRPELPTDDALLDPLSERMGELAEEFARAIEAEQWRIATGIEGALRAASEGGALDYFARNLQNAIFEHASQGLAEALVGNIGQGAFSRFFSGILTGSFTGPTKRAAGGNFGAGDMLMTGESGPELVATGAAGVVLNAAATRALAGQAISTQPQTAVKERVVVVQVDKSALFETSVREVAAPIAVAEGNRAIETVRIGAAIDQREQTRALGVRR